ncbi:MAG TPA: hypothetical protein VFB92_08805 [Vicinamibacterales bacterium]|nr:hypothetical protein [Vicinamibacterales bacterium]
MLAKWLPPVLLVVVAALQVGLAQTVDLTAWKGGGFGMFSTLDHGAYRGVDIVVDAPDRSESLEIPLSLETAAARAAACPTGGLLRALAEGIAAREQRYQRVVTRVTVTAWRTDFDRGTLQASERPLRTFTFVVP